jgi:hypothetical protein
MPEMNADKTSASAFICDSIFWLIPIPRRVSTRRNDCVSRGLLLRKACATMGAIKA